MKILFILVIQVEFHMVQEVMTLLKICFTRCKLLLQHNVKMVIAACGTVSSVAGDLLRAQDYPYTGVVNPTVYTAVRTTKNKRVGVIGTSATIGSHSYKKD